MVLVFTERSITPLKLNKKQKSQYFYEVFVRRLYSNYNQLIYFFTEGTFFYLQSRFLRKVTYFLYLLSGYFLMFFLLSPVLAVFIFRINASEYICFQFDTLICLLFPRTYFSLRFPSYSKYCILTFLAHSLRAMFQNAFYIYTFHFICTFTVFKSTAF